MRLVRRERQEKKMAIQVWIESGTSITLDELIELVPNSKAAKEVELMRETLRGIVEADWRSWEELASPDEFVRWAKHRANHALSA